MGGQIMLGDVMLPELSGVRNAAELRRVLAPLERTRDARWLRLDGLGVEPLETHGAFLHSLTRCGLGAEVAGLVAQWPAVAVLDWSFAEECSAEGLALLPLVVHALHARGTHVMCCAPTDPHLAALVDSAQLRGACAGACRRRDDGVHFGWIEGAGGSGPAAAGRGGGGKARLLVPLTMIQPAVRDGRAGQFLNALKSGALAVGLDGDLAELVTSVTTEVLQNVFEYSGAEKAAAVALLWPRRRPAVLEIGVADGGLGIGGSVVSQPRHSGLGAFPESTQAEIVFAGGLSSRAPEAGGGGGLSLILRDLVDRCGATVNVRSGAGRVEVSQLGRGLRPVRGTTYGWGTQTRIAIKVPANGGTPR